VAVATPAGDEVLASDDEPALLAALDELIARLPPGVLVTWNGSAFDLPFLATRAAACELELGLVLAGGGSPAPLRSAPGLGAYRASWHGHDHLDAYRVYRNDLPRLLPPVSCSLKSVARLVGLAVIEEDRTALHRLSAQRLADYVASDARLARALAECRWRTAVRFLDRLIVGQLTPVAV